MIKFTEIKCLYPTFEDSHVMVVDQTRQLMKQEDYEDFKLNFAINFKCEKGYKLVGSENAVCKKKGKFVFGNDKPPHCEG